jgi:hypothetical protein
MKRYELYPYSSPVPSFCEHGNEPLGSIKLLESERLSNYLILKKYPVP